MLTDNTHLVLLLYQPCVIAGRRTRRHIRDGDKNNSTVVLLLCKRVVRVGRTIVSSLCGSGYLFVLTSSALVPSGQASGEHVFKSS